MRRFAADPHFGVREIAWMAVRDAVIGSLDESLALLQPWVSDADPNIRRFASELTRPRGVWCAQIEALKAEPWRALPLIEPLRADSSRYVQNSVANWLNDASKTDAGGVGREAVHAMGGGVGCRCHAVHREAGPADPLQSPMIKARQCRAFC